MRELSCRYSLQQVGIAFLADNLTFIQNAARNESVCNLPFPLPKLWSGLLVQHRMITDNDYDGD